DPVPAAVARVAGRHAAACGPCSLRAAGESGAGAGPPGPRPRPAAQDRADSRFHVVPGGRARALQRLVVRSRTAFGGGPVDDAVRILDVAGLAMHTVGRVDLQPLATLTIVHHLVHIGRTEALAGIAEFPGATLGAQRRIANLQ